MLSISHKLRLEFVLACFGLLSGTIEGHTFAAEEQYCMNTPAIPVRQPALKSVDFASWSGLSAYQKNLLEDFFGAQNAINEYVDLVSTDDGKAAAFLSVTNALAHLTFAPGTSDEISGLDIVQGIKEIRSDRLILYLDLARIKSWMKSGVKYSVDLNGPTKSLENGKINFYNHGTPSAGLHCGYDLQWYTKASKAPHLHWNVRFSDGQADVHLDGYSPWLAGFIPNFRHLTYENSDVRYWYGKYLKKYGNAGFDLVKRN